MPMMNLISLDSAIDHKELLTRCMGNAQFAARILEAFQRQLSGDIEALDAAILAGNAAEVALIAHRVKGASSNVSAHRLSRLADSLGEFAKNGAIELLPSCSENIREEHRHFCESAQQFAASSG